jgi:hypothetical protein
VLSLATFTPYRAAGKFAPIGVALALAACASPPPGYSVAVLPGIGKDTAAFQQDEQVCQQHAVAHTGYTNRALSAPPETPAGITPNGTAPAAPANAAANAVVPPGVQPFDATGYLQCMAARGDTVQPQPYGYADAAYPYGNVYPDGYAYGYPYAADYPYPFYDDGFYGGFGWGGFGNGHFHQGGFVHRGFGHGGFARGGFAHGGFAHGGFAHGGFGGGHGGGGHR